MDFYAFLGLLRRQWLVIFVLAAAATLAAGALHTLQPPTQKTTLLFSTGVASESSLERGTETTKLADDFARTVAGWTRSPTFGEKVSGLAGVPVGVASAPQAKQNFLAVLTYDSAEAADRITAAARQVFEDEIEKYNTNSKLKFFITLHGESRAPDRPALPLALAAAATGGVLLAIAWIVLHAYFGGRVSSVREAEKIMRTRAAVVFANPERAEINFLKALIKKSGPAVLAGADVSVKKISGKINLEIKTARLPTEAEKIGKNETKILVVQLDKTRVSTLRQIRALWNEEIKLVIWG